MARQAHIARLLDEAPLSLEEVAASCTVSGEWIIRQVEAGILLAEPDRDPSRWVFGSRDILRIRRLLAVSRDFDADPELAGLVADLLEELDRLRARLRRAGLAPD